MKEGIQVKNPGSESCSLSISGGAFPKASLWAGCTVQALVPGYCCLTDT